MLSTLVKHWKTEDPFSEIRKANVDLIVPVSYTTLRDRLAIATEMNLKMALRYHVTVFRRKPKFAFSSCSYPFSGAEMVEDRLKTGFCNRMDVVPIQAKPMMNTVDEAMRIKETLEKRNFNPHCILLVTGVLHSPSARYIWEKLFPDARILISCTPREYEVQPDHMVFNQRKMWKWVLSNIKREIALRILPLSFVRTIRHTAAESEAAI